MALIEGIHHVSLKCSNCDEYIKTIDFYTTVLGLHIVKKWNDGVMLDSGSGYIEIFASGTNSRIKGAIRHLAFAVSNVDECVSAVRAAGYDVFMEPSDIDFESTPTCKARIAFCRGPLGEEIEFFQEYDNLES